MSKDIGADALNKVQAKSDKYHNPRHQRGVSLFIVMVILLLSLLVVLGALNMTNLNEAIVGNQSDAQRAYGAAEALLDAARLDIRLNGRYCLDGKNATFHSMRQSAGIVAACTPRYPPYVFPVSQETCRSGICSSSSPSDPAFDISKITTSSSAQQPGNGISYGNQYVTSVQGAANYSDNANVGDLNLFNNGNGVNGVYWVEIFSVGNNTAMMPNAKLNAPPLPDPLYPYIFRITVMAWGLKLNTASRLKSSTVSILRVYYVPYPVASAALNGA